MLSKIRSAFSRSKLNLMPSRKLTLCAIFLIGASTFENPTQALNVTQPTSSTIVPAGDDFATQVLGNAWDMNDAVDIDTQESAAYVSGMTFSGGIFSGSTLIDGAGLFPLYMGIGGTVNLSRGASHPIDTGRYRYVTIKLRANTAGQAVNVYFYLNGDSTVTNTIGVSHYHALPTNQWSIVTIDMVTDLFGPVQWTDYPQLAGLRVDPANGHPVGFDIDWIRLTAPVSTQNTMVQWTDSGAPGGSTYDIAAIDSSGVSYALVNSVSGISYQADMTFLAPGQYTIQVTRHATAVSGTATFHINNPPQIAITAPSVRGEQSLNFAQTVTGNPWGPMDAADFSVISNFASSNFTTVPNSFYGRPATSDPGWILNLHGNTVDTSLYRSLCFKQEVFGSRSVGAAARVFWGAGNNLTTSQPISLDDNLGDTVVSEYCIPDLAAAPLEANPNGGTWSGTKAVFRIDPDEFTPPGGCSTMDTCHDVRLDSVILAPFATANPSYTTTWSLTDPETAAGGSVRLLLNPNRTNDLSQSITIATLPYVTGAQQYRFTTKRTIPNATYYVGVQATDGLNTVLQFSGGPIVLDNTDIIFNDGFDG